MTGSNLPKAERRIFRNAVFTYLFVAIQALLGITGGLVMLEMIGLTSEVGLSLIGIWLVGTIVCGIAIDRAGNVVAS